jgi:hypothetical protein
LPSNTIKQYLAIRGNNEGYQLVSSCFYSRRQTELAAWCYKLLRCIYYLSCSPIFASWQWESRRHWRVPIIGHFLYILYLYTNVLRWFMRIKIVCVYLYSKKEIFSFNNDICNWELNQLTSPMLEGGDL